VSQPYNKDKKNTCLPTRTSGNDQPGTDHATINVLQKKFRKHVMYYERWGNMENKTKYIALDRGKNSTPKKDSFRYLKNNIWLYIFAAPAIIAVFIFEYMRMPGVIMAFQHFDPMKGFIHSPFVGLENFANIFTDADLPRIIKNTLVISALGFFIGFPLPIIFAILITEVRSIRFKKFIQSTSYLPHFISWVIVAGIMYDLMDADKSLFNKIIGLFGYESRNYISDPNIYWYVSVAISIWKELGWQSIIFISAIVSIDQEQYEAAIVDGASRFQRIIHITLPGIMPTVAIVLILQAGLILTGAGLSPGFDGAFNIGNPGNDSQSQVLDVWIYREGVRRMSYSFATAVGLVLALINLTFVFIANRSANKINNSGVF
jgi:putative aldouronate transport system permease protein